jgi:dCMP deaminase
LGYNGLPQGVRDLDERYQDRDVKIKLTRHAEANAIDFAQEPLYFATIFVWPFLPCPQCAGSIIQNGISRVVTFESKIAERWDGDWTRIMFQETNTELIEY